VGKLLLQIGRRRILFTVKVSFYRYVKIGVNEPHCGGELDPNGLWGVRVGFCGAFASERTYYGLKWDTNLK
jgi:hypothetical protein